MSDLTGELQRDAQDLIYFADPFTDPKVKNTSKGFRVAMVRNGRDVSYEVDENSGRVSLGHRKSVSFSNVNSLIASEEFADLSLFSKTQLRAYKKPKLQIPVRLKFKGEFFEDGGLAGWLAERHEGLQLLLLDGPAGIGKTFQIETAVVEQAEKVAKGSMLPPILHVSSKGRRLSNLTDVLAWSTQALGAKFGAIHVPLLVRRGLLTIAIDGFDELVDADGYEDAWSALKNFISDIGHGGTLILAARDTFVDQQELLGRIGEETSKIHFSQINIRTAESERVISWLSKAPHWKANDITSETTREVLVDGSYTLRPFFLKELREAKGWKEVLEFGPRSFLINRYLERESKLIAKQLGVTPDLMLPPLSLLFEEIALQMAEREVDWIEVEQLAFMTEYAYDGVLGESEIKKLAHKAGSFAFLEVADVGRARTFPHSEIRNYFLGRGILRSMACGSLPAVLRRGVLNAEHMDVFAEVMYSDIKLASEGTNFLVSQLRAASQSESYSGNAGALALLSSSLGLVERLDYLDVVDATFAGGSPKLELGHSTIGRLDVRDSDISGLRIQDTHIDTLVANEHTRFSDINESVENLEFHEGDALTVIRGKLKVTKWVDDRRASQSVGGEDSSAVVLMERLARRVIRHHYLREKGGDDDATFLLQDENWPLVKNALEAYGRLEVITNKQMKGRNSVLYRILRPRELLDRREKDTQEILRWIGEH